MDLSLIGKTYQDAVDTLLKKYGSATGDYFSRKSYDRFKAGEIKAPTRNNKIARTSEGLYCHHIDENKVIFISSAAAISELDIAFEYQTKDRLVYCNLIEHAILHILIAGETANNPSNEPLGIQGYAFFMRPRIINWYVDGVTP